MSASSASIPRPVTEQYDDVISETVTVAAPGGYAGPALLYRPAAPGPHPGVAIGMEATGINHFRRAGDVGVILITHYTRILRHVTPDFVHVFAGGRIAESGGAELAERLENEGYERFTGRQEAAHIG